VIHRLALVVLLVVGGLLGSGQMAGGQDASLYPDLQTLPPSDLFFDRISGGTHILRFSNTVWNAGEGRLEIQGNPKPPKKRDTTNNTLRQIYQNLYDAPVGGAQTLHKQVASDAIYHAGHQHFHFADFASYLLLKQDATGVYQETAKKGSKTSFCIMDTSLIQGSYRDQYRACGGELQGLTPGWGDTYDYTLVDQWVVLGNQPLEDGEYGLQSTADPINHLDEAVGDKNDPRESNNTAVTYFTVSGGQIGNVRNSP
jgi:hypothetical protein